MNDLISRSEAKREMTFEEEAALYEKEARELFAKEKPGDEAPPVNHLIRRGMRIIRKAREEMSAVDAVPVVRCKDCKYPKRASIIEGFFICGLLKQTVKDDDYCSYGERRNGDG